MKVMFTPMAGMSMPIVVVPVTDTLTPFLLKPELTWIWSNRIWGCVGGIHDWVLGQQGLPSGLSLTPQSADAPLGAWGPSRPCSGPCPRRLWELTSGPAGLPW